MKHAGAGAPRARGADGLQRARPADEPGRRARAGGRRLRARTSRARSPTRSSGSTRGAPTSCTAPAGSTSSRRPARTSSARSTRGARARVRARPAVDSASRAATRTSCAAATPATNAAALRDVLAGADGGHRSAVLLNAAGAIAAGGHAADLREGLALAREAIDSGAAARAARPAGRVLASAGGRMSRRLREPCPGASHPHRSCHSFLRGTVTSLLRKRPCLRRNGPLSRCQQHRAFGRPRADGRA